MRKYFGVEGDESDMTHKKNDEKIITGYDETDFDDSYWTAKVGDKPRYQRDPVNIVKYFKDLFDLLCLASPGSIIDICAGSGNIVNGLRNAGLDAYGCEFSSSGRRVAKRIFNVDLDAFDLRKKFPYKDNEFNWGCCIASLSMVPMNKMEDALKEIFRVVRYGVLIYVATAAGKVQDGIMVNPHHLTGINHNEYLRILKSIGVHDFTNLLNPSGPKYGIGTGMEFTGLFSKRDFYE